MFDFAKKRLRGLLVEQVCSFLSFIHNGQDILVTLKARPSK
jgi:hypothetical protein